MMEFVNFSEDINDCSCYVPLPVAYMSDLVFFLPDASTGRFSIATIFGDSISDTYTPTDNWVKMSFDLSDLLACGECFRILMEKNNITQYSNIFMYRADEKETLLIRFKCNEPTFGIDYDGVNYSQIRLPAELSNPQVTKEESVYTDLNGKRRTLFAELRKRYTFNTDFLPEEVHYNINLLFSHNNVWIDDIEMCQDGEYTVSWEDTDYSGCQPLAMGETTVVENTIQRNSTC